MSRVTSWLIVVMLAAAAPVIASTRDVGAMLTESRTGRGRIEVSGPGTVDWRPAGPLLALKVGDSLRATDDAAAVVVLAGRRGSVQVDATRSPFVVTAPPADSRMQKAFLLLESGLGFLGSNPRETPRPVLSTRSVSRPPVILSPRMGPVMPDTLAFEWQGDPVGRYSPRMFGGSGVVVERSGAAGSRRPSPAGG